MIRYVYAANLPFYPTLRSSMFLDRTEQFKNRHGWAVNVDKNGFEVDEYDALNPLYAIWQADDGTHGGSIRVLPTMGPTMVNDHFRRLAGGAEINSPVIWECTRFCVSPRFTGNQSKVAAALILAGCELGLRFGLESSIGVVYSHTLPIYRRIGWIPEVIGASGEGREEISVCLWPIDLASKAAICQKSGFLETTVEDWFHASFPSTQESPVLAVA